MLEVNIPLAAVNSDALKAALQSALGSTKALGVSTYGSTRPISIWLDDSATASDKQQAAAIAQAHDPVFLSVDKTSIAADGVDTATITVLAPKSSSAVALLIGNTAVPLILTNGSGSITLVSSDPATIPVTVQNPFNRTTNALIVEAN